MTASGCYRMSAAFSLPLDPPDRPADGRTITITDDAGDIVDNDGDSFDDINTYDPRSGRGQANMAAADRTMSGASSMPGAFTCPPVLNLIEDLMAGVSDPRMRGDR